MLALGAKEILAFEPSSLFESKEKKITQTEFEKKIIELAEKNLTAEKIGEELLHDIEKNTVDFVVVFIPNEMIFSFIYERFPALLEEAFNKKGRPNITLKLNKLNEENIGSLIYIFELQVALLGEIFNVNAFDQPAVELYKEETRRILQGHREERM